MSSVDISTDHLNAQPLVQPARMGLLVRLAFILVPLLIMAPEILFGLSTSNSLLYNVVWGEQVSALMRVGTLYPRWLPNGWSGLGSPAFYFYSPLFFLATGAVSAGFLGQIGSDTAVSLTSAGFMAASGFAMRGWLLRWGTARAATLGSLVYLFAPYRLHDIFNRGSLAEATAYLGFPLLMIGLARIKARQANGVACAALGYVALITGHLPVALLATVTLVPAYVVWAAFDAKAVDRVFLLRALAGGVLGLGLSGAFLLPALGLMPYVSAEQLSSEYYAPQTWFLFTGPNSIFAGQVLDIVLQTFALSTGYLLVAVAAWFVARGTKGMALWGLLATACFVMISGILPFLWQLPGIKQVQFPSRMLSVMEFVTITALVCARGRLWLPGAVFGALMILPASWSIIDLAAQRMAQVQETRQAKQKEHHRAMRDAPEYLPAGYPVGIDDYGRADPDLTRLPQVPLITAHGGDVTELTANRRRDGGLSVTVDAKGPATLHVRRFVFPHWRVISVADGALVPTRADAQKLVSWDVPAGRHGYELVAGHAPYERLGYAVTGCSTVILLLLVSGSMRRRRMPK